MHLAAGLSVDTKFQAANATRHLLKQSPLPDGVFCPNDPPAIGAMNAIREAGFRIPEDIAVVGCGNPHYHGSLRFPLSTVDRHRQKI